METARAGMAGLIDLIRKGILLKKIKLSFGILVEHPHFSHPNSENYSINRARSARTHLYVILVESVGLKNCFIVT